MRVKNSSKIFSENVSSALIAYKQKFQMFAPCHATAKLLCETAKWFKAVNNYHFDQALSATDIHFLNDFKKLLQTLHIKLLAENLLKLIFQPIFQKIINFQILQ